MVRTVYREQLVALAAKIAGICGLATTAMASATQALLRADLALAERVIGGRDDMISAVLRAEDAAILLLALQAPVASDLRAIVTSIQNVGDVERMGALAVHVAKVARRRYPDHALPEEVRGDFSEMGKIATELGNATQEALLMRDPQTAARLAYQDDAMDDLHRRLFTVLMDPDWKHGVTSAVDVTLLGRFYERFADHAVEIGRRVIFQVTGSPADGEQRS